MEKGRKRRKESARRSVSCLASLVFSILRPPPKKHKASASHSPRCTIPCSCKYATALTTVSTSLAASCSWKNCLAQMRSKSSPPWQRSVTR